MSEKCPIDESDSVSLKDNSRLVLDDIYDDLEFGIDDSREEILPTTRSATPCRRNNLLPGTYNHSDERDDRSKICSPGSTNRCNYPSSSLTTQKCPTWMDSPQATPREPNNLDERHFNTPFASLWGDTPRGLEKNNDLRLERNDYDSDSDSEESSDSCRKRFAPKSGSIGIRDATSVSPGFSEGFTGRYSEVWPLETKHRTSECPRPTSIIRPLTGARETEPVNPSSTVSTPRCQLETPYYQPTRRNTTISTRDGLDLDYFRPQRGSTPKARTPALEEDVSRTKTPSYHGNGPVPRSTSTSRSRPSTGSLRPLSTIRAACYSPESRRSSMTGRRSSPERSRVSSDRRSAPQLVKKVNTPIEEMRDLELQLCDLIVQCRQADNLVAALELAKDAKDMERKIYFTYKSNAFQFPYNTSLTFTAVMNLAIQLEANGMYKEALKNYQVINKSSRGVFAHSYRVKINMGNMYVKMCQYPLAVKTYRMALDQVPLHYASIRVKILRSIGIVFLKTKELCDAIYSFQCVMEEKPSFVDGMSLMACLYAVESREEMQSCFETLLSIPLNLTKEENFNVLTWTPDVKMAMKCLEDTIKFDSLSKMERKTKHEAEKVVMISAKLLSKVFNNLEYDGYDWCIERMKNSQFAHLVGEMQIAKANMLLKLNNTETAVSLLKEMQHNDETELSVAATNLSFIHLTQQDLKSAEKCSAIACEADCYSSYALVNYGCCLLFSGELEMAKEKFTMAVGNDSSCIEALYNLGLTNKRMELYEDALSCFLKLHSMFKDDEEVMYQVASLYELTGDCECAIDAYQKLLCMRSENVVALNNLGRLFESTGDDVQAYHFFVESYRLLPSQVKVLVWLGTYALKTRCPPEQAAKYFKLAIVCQPTVVKYHLMLASCYRRSGDLNKATKCYEAIHKLFPDDKEPLKHLIKLHMPTDSKKAKEFALLLKKLEKTKLQQTTLISSRPSTANSIYTIDDDPNTLFSSRFVDCNCPSLSVKTPPQLECTRYFPKYSDYSAASLKEETCSLINEQHFVGEQGVRCCCSEVGSPNHSQLEYGNLERPPEGSRRKLEDGVTGLSPQVNCMNEVRLSPGMNGFMTPRTLFSSMPLGCVLARYTAADQTIEGQGRIRSLSSRSTNKNSDLSQIFAEDFVEDDLLPP